MTHSRAQHEWRGPRLARGIAAVEFVACVPFLLLLLFGASEVGRALIHYSTLTYSIRQSARYVAAHSLNGTTGVVSLSATTITEARNLAVYGNILGAGNPKLPNYQTGQVQVEDLGGDLIRVIATYPYQPMLGSVMPDVVLGGGSFALGFNMQTAMTLRAIPSDS